MLNYQRVALKKCDKFEILAKKTWKGYGQDRKKLKCVMMFSNNTVYYSNNRKLAIEIALPVR